MAKAPSFQFYPGDWMKDPEVCKLSPNARGILFDLICMMHENERSGIVSGNMEQLARISRSTMEEFQSAYLEFNVTNVLHVTVSNKIVTLVNRRMNRIYNELKSTKLRVKKFRENKNVTEKLRLHSSSSSSTSVKNIKKEGVKWITNPTKHFDLTDQEIIQTHEFILGVKNIKLTNTRIKNLWSAFQTNSFDGEKYYQTRARCTGHFRNWLNTQELGTSTIENNISESGLPANLKRI